MIGNYFNGVIEQVYHRIGQEEQNIVMACYGNSLTVSGLETVKRYSEESDGVFFACTELEQDRIVGAYEPFLDIICEMFRRYETGSFDIYTAIEPINIEKTISAIIKEIKNFEKRPIAKEEFERAKIKIKSSILMQFENIGYRSSNLLHNIMIKDKLPSKKEIIEKIENTKIEDLIEILESIINSKPTLAIYGNVEEKNYYDLLLDSLK